MTCVHCHGPHAASRCNTPIALLRRSLVSLSGRSVGRGVPAHEVARECLENAAALLALSSHGAPREMMPGMFARDARDAIERAIAETDRRTSAAGIPAGDLLTRGRR